MKTTNNTQLLDRLNLKGTVKLNFFNGYGWTDNTKKFIDFLANNGLINKIHYRIENISSPSKFKQRIILN